jgi:hypothetical protein
MELKSYRIVYRPFPESSLTSEFVMTGTGLTETLDRFEKLYPTWNIVSITED